MSIVESMVGEFFSNKTLMLGVFFLVISFLLSLLSMYSEYHTLSIPAAMLAIFGAILAIRGYILFLKKIETQQSNHNDKTVLIF